MKLYLLAIAAALVMGIAIGFGRYVIARRHAAASTWSPSPVALAAQYRVALKADLEKARAAWSNGPGPEMGYVGSGDSQPRSVRFNSCAALGFAVIAAGSTASSAVAPPQPTLSSLSAAAHGAAAHDTAPAPAAIAATVHRGDWLARTTSLLHFLTYSHRSGPGAASDGQKWGGTDAAAVDAANIGLAAQLVRPALDSSTLNGVSEVVRFEAGRYLLSSPASGSSGDSAAVANAAACRILVSTAMFYSSGETRVAYERRAVDYLGHVLSTFDDTGFVDPGTAPGNQPTLFPDLTMQYDSAFSPSAELQVVGSLGWCSIVYQLAGQPEPLELRRHVLDCWRRVLVKLSAADGWFLSGQGSLVSGGLAVSWIAGALGDPAADVMDAAEVARIARHPDLLGDDSTTPLSSPRLGDLAGQELVYELFPALPISDLSPSTVMQSLNGVTWLRTAALAINRVPDVVDDFSWAAGAGQQWDMANGRHVQWRFSPGASGPVPATSGEAPAWMVTSDSFSTVAALRLEAGIVHAGVCSLPDGSVLLLERVESANPDAGISLYESMAAAEPDLFRDDEGGSPPAEGVRWANLDNRIGLLILQGSMTQEAAAGVDERDRPRPDWPLLTVVPGADHLAIVVLAPHQTWKATREAATSLSPLHFAGPGWAGALAPGSEGREYLVYSRLGGAASMVLAASSPRGAPVLAEDAIVTDRMTSAPLSSPAGTLRWEAVSCWVTGEGGASIDCHRGAEANTAVFDNPGQATARATIQYLSSGRTVVLKSEEGRTLARLAARPGVGEIHCYMAPGRTLTLAY